MPDLVFYILVFFAVGVFFLFIHMLMGHFIRPNRPDDEKLTIYECGEPTVGSAWIQFDLRYYVVALLFVVFDVEVAFFFPWAIVFGKANELANLPEKNAALEVVVEKLTDVEARLAKAAPEERKSLQDEKALLLGQIQQLDRRAALTRELAPANLNLVARSQPPTPEPDQKAASQPDPNKKGEPPGQKAPGGGKKDAGGKGKSGKGDGEKGKDGPTAAAGGGAGKGGPLLPPPPPVTVPPKSIPPIPADVAKTWAWIAFADIMVFFGVLLVGFAYLWRRGDINWIRSVAAEQET